MKKTLTMALGLAVVAATAFAEATYSKNAVGFITIDAKANKLYALTMPLENMDPSDNSNTEGLWKFEDLQFAKDAKIGSTVYFWSGTGWKPYSKNFIGEWGTDGYTLKVGECFFFEPAEDMSITMAGQVPDSEKSQVVVTGAKNLSAIGNPYPVPLDFEKSQVAQDAKISATVYFWNGTGWKPYSKNFIGEWGTDGYQVPPGEGFFFETTEDAETATWDVDKPYVYP